MPKTFLPLVSAGGAAPIKVAIDPITRIEGHLRIEVLIKDGRVVDAWSVAPMFRGLELVMRNRDPRDAWVFAQRVCGVCTTVHAIASVRAVENGLGITVPDNARLIRNILEGIQFIQDHTIHFYHLHAFDWVDLVSALGADPAAASHLAQALSDWPNSGADYFASVQNRLKTFVSSGQLGLFANAYWGHPAYKLPPEANLVAVAHYLEALDWQREIIKMHAILGGKNPHPQTYLVGGMALPVHPTEPAALNQGRIAQLKDLANKAYDFVTRVYMPDLLMVASYYPEWATLGAGVGNYLSVGDFPQDNSGSPAALWLPQGVVFNKNLGAPPQAVNQEMIKEYIRHSWYDYPEGDSVGKSPSAGVTAPNYTGPALPYDMVSGVTEKYSWMKAPRYGGAAMEVGPLARMVVAYAAGHSRARELVDNLLASLGVGPAALFSTLGRVAARGVETLMVAEEFRNWVGQLEYNINNGNLVIHNGSKWDPSAWPATWTGWGVSEAPRGALGHWLTVTNGKIDNYQMIVPTTWNGSPRATANDRGAWEEALIGTPVRDPEKPVEILRTVHSFDPCMACAVHVVDVAGTEVTRITVVE
jgi:Ni,Fe-hydrogenase I large subunit